MTSATRVPAWQWCLALATGTALSLLMWHGLLEDSELNGGDTWPYFMPQKVVLADSLQRNELPIWHDLTGLGYPLLAESQAGVFYPSNQILYRLFEINRAYAISIILHYALAFTFAWRFIRSQKVSCLTSLLAAMVYVYGWFPARISLEWSIIGGMWLPLTLWLTHEFMEKASRWKFAALTTALATHLLAGHFTLAFINELCLVCYALLHWVFRTRMERTQLLTAVAIPGGILLSLVLASAQLLPSMELKQISQRDESGLEDSQRRFDPGYGHMPPLYLTQLVASWSWWHTPEIRASRQILHLPGSISSDTNAVEAHFYLGLIPVSLAGLCLIPATSRGADPVIRRMWFILGLASVIYATGWLLPVTRYLPGFTFFMGPGRYTIVASLSGAILCGTALDCLVHRSGARILCVLLIGAVTWVDMGWSTRPIADAVQVPAIWPAQEHSWIRQYFSEQPARASRLLASGPNVGNMFGVSSVPQYLGIGPAVYFGEAFDLATSPDDERFLTSEQLAKIRGLGVTHLLTDQPVHDSDHLMDRVGAGPDVLLNRIWGAAGQPRYLYALKNPGQRLFSEPAAAILNWKCVSSSNHSIVFDITLTEPAIVHLRELMYPGWMASIDGKPVASKDLDDLLRSVDVPAGVHVLEWRMQSDSVVTGMWIFVCCPVWTLVVSGDPLSTNGKSFQIMRAAFVNSHGPADSLAVGDVADPADPAAGELLIEITTSAVNPIDTYIRSGAVGGTIQAAWIPGCDFAGVVLAVSDDVTDFAIGDRVWGSNQSLAGRQGTLAQKISVDQQWVYPIPDGITDESAAAGALTGITAQLGLHLHGQLQSGETVFVNGGTGGVGSAVIQLAKIAGANVIATVGSVEKEALAKRLGADTVINYRETDVAAAIQEATASTGGIDVWFETLRTPTPESTIPLMAKRGRMIVMAGRDARPVLPVGPLYVNDLRIIGFAMFNASAAEQREAASAINAAASAGKYQPLIGKRFSLHDAAKAHQLQEDNTIGVAGTLTGKIVVTIDR